MSQTGAERDYAQIAEESRKLRPFYWMLTAILAAIYLWSLLYSPPLREPARLFAFTVLMIITTALHWTTPNVSFHRRWLLPYLVTQGALAFAITTVAESQGVTLGLYLGLAGEAVGILENLRLSVIAVVCCVGLAAINFGA